MTQEQQQEDQEKQEDSTKEQEKNNNNKIHEKITRQTTRTLTRRKTGKDNLLTRSVWRFFFSVETSAKSRASSNSSPGTPSLDSVL